MGHNRRHFIKDISLLGLGVPAVGLTKFSWSDQLLPRNESKPLVFFDAFTQIGPRRINHSRTQTKLSELLDEMDYCSINGALVASTLSLSYDAHFSNLRLSKWLEPYSHLFAIWNLLPPGTGEFPELADLGPMLRQHNVAAVTIYPKSNAWDWQANYHQELFDWLSKNKILTIIPDISELGDWRELDVFLRRFPQLPVLLRNISWSAQRYVIPLLKTYRNLHICFDTFQINEGPEYFYEEGLIDQLIFASNAPTMSAGAHRTLIDYAQIPGEAKEKIASGNLVKLIPHLKFPTRNTRQDLDLLIQSSQSGSALPVDVLDMHMHILHEGLNGAGRHYRMRNGGPKGVFSMVDKLGYSGGGIMSWDGVVSQDAASGNETTALALDGAPQGFWGLGTFDPTQFSQTEMEKMIRTVYQDQRFIGMKPYLMYGVEYDDPAYDIWWQFGNQRQFYGLLHNAHNDLRETEVLAEKYPRVRWLIAHAASSFNIAEKAIELIKKYPNVFAEITYTSVPLGAIEYLVQEGGENRVVYGSDLPMRDPRPQLGWVIYSRLPLTLKQKILSENALDIINPCISRLPEFNRPALKK